MSPHEYTATLLAALVVVGAVAGVTALGMAVGPVVADQHTKDDATDYTEETDFTVNLPYDTDHYPGDQNEENGSIEYFYVGEDAMREMGAEDGAYIDYIIISADWIDYSACQVENTESFGIDRGDDNEGTQTDEDLVQRHKEATFRDDGLTVEFYDWEDLGGDPPYLAPEDEVVASQGAGSAGGPCLTMTSEPGWYQIQGFMNGTEADNGQGEQPSDDAERAGGIAYSNYVYVCECDSEEEAREQLGPPPSEGSGDGETTSSGGEGSGDGDGSDGDGSADDDTPSGDEGDGDAGDGAGSDAAATPTADDAGEGDGAGGGADGDGAGTDGGGNEGDGTGAGGDGDGADGNGSDGGDGSTGDANGSGPGGGGGTPTADDGPGFGAVAALLAVLAGALIARRRA